MGLLVKKVAKMLEIWHGFCYNEADFLDYLRSEHFAQAYFPQKGSRGKLWTQKAQL